MVPKAGFEPHGFPHHPLKARRLGKRSGPLLNNRNRINAEVPPRHLPDGRTEIPSSTSLSGDGANITRYHYRHWQHPGRKNDYIVFTDHITSVNRSHGSSIILQLISETFNNPGNDSTDNPRKMNKSIQKRQKIYSICNLNNKYPLLTTNSALTWNQCWLCLVEI